MNKYIQKFNNFMRGRYGIDVLSRDLIWFSMIVIVLNIFIKNVYINLSIPIILAFAYIRIFSKKRRRRSQENHKYTNTKNKVTKPFRKGVRYMKDIRKYKYFKCPTCSQKLRLPRGRKKIIITCPRCNTKFDGRT